MNTISKSSEAVRSAFEHPTRGVIGLVDDLLMLCREHGLQFDWHADRCRVRCLGDGSEELMDLPFGKSVFRAMLARVAVLCNERVPNSVSPYGGQGELSVGANPTGILSVMFVNTPE